jgi:hypothetical protein
MTQWTIVGVALEVEEAKVVRGFLKEELNQTEIVTYTQTFPNNLSLILIQNHLYIIKMPYSFKNLKMTINSMITNHPMNLLSAPTKVQWFNLRRRSFLLFLSLRFRWIVPKIKTIRASVSINSPKCTNRTWVLRLSAVNMSIKTEIMMTTMALMKGKFSKIRIARWATNLIDRLNWEMEMAQDLDQLKNNQVSEGHS